MFGSKKSTDECYKNERTFECCNVCSCPTSNNLQYTGIHIYIYACTCTYTHNKHKSNADTHV